MKNRMFSLIAALALMFGAAFAIAPDAHASWGDGSDESGWSSLFDTWCPQ